MECGCTKDSGRWRASAELKGSCSFTLTAFNSRAQPKAAQELTGEVGIGWNKAGAAHLTSVLVFWCQVAKPPVGWDPHRALPTLLRGSTADRARSRDSPESWDMRRGQQPGQSPCSTGVTLSQLLCGDRAQRSAQDPFHWPQRLLVRLQNWQQGEDNYQQVLLTPGLTSHKQQHSAGEVRLTMGFDRDQQLFGALTEVYGGKSCKLQVSDSWKIFSLFTIFCCFSWQWKKLYI